jgi:uncharacterized protein (TIRG00374 family)
VKQLRLIIGLLVSIGLLWLMFRATNVAELVGALRDANYVTIIPAVVVYFVGIWLRSLRWQLLLRPLTTLSSGRLFQATIIGFTANNLMPVRLGEVARAILLARWAGVAPAATLGTIVVERLFDGLTLSAVFSLAWLWLPATSWLRLAAILSAVAFIAGSVVALAMAFWPKFLLAMLRRMLVWLPERIQSKLLRLFQGFVEGFSVLRRGHLLLPIVALSIGAWLTEATMYYIIMRGFALDTSFLAALLGMAAGNLGTMIPSSPGYVGTFDVPLQTVLTELFGIEPAVATSFTLVVHAALLVPVVVVGLVLLSREGLSLADVSRGASDRQESVSPSTETATRTL